MKTQLIAIVACCLLIPFISFAQAIEEEPVQEQQMKAKIEFKESTYDFGTIESGEVVNRVFKFTNTGEYPLIITDAKGSCGCTVPFYPQVPIMPGESSEIEVSFNSKGKQGRQTKRVTITANTDPAQTFLTFSGDVLAPSIVEETEEETAAYLQKQQEINQIKALDPNCMAIFPNPTNDILQLELKEHIGMSATVDILSDKGEKILSKKIDHISRETTQFDVSKFVPGTYLISIHIDEMQPMTQCFVVTGK